MSPSLREATVLLRSDKIKERQEGLGLIRDIFKSTHNVGSLDSKGWLETFQALFAAVMAEKATCLKRGSLQNAQTVAKNRLREYAATVRWLTGQTVSHLSYKVVKALLSHLLDMLDYRGSLLEPIALDYLHALNHIFSYPPHLEHIDPDTWSVLVFTFFAIVLREPLNTAEPSMGDWEMDVDAPADSASRPSRRYDVRQEDKAAMLCVRTLMSSPSAPLITSKQIGRKILAKFVCFFRAFGSETSAHLDALHGLNRVLEELQFNACGAVAALGKHLWPLLLEQWKPKTILKEQLLIGFRLLAPFVCMPTSEASLAELRSDVSSHDIGKLYRLIAEDAEARPGAESLRGGTDALSVQPLTLDNIAFEYRPATSLPQAFSSATIRHGRLLTPARATSWAALELEADVLWRLFELSEGGVRRTPVGDAAASTAEFSNDGLIATSQLSMPFSSTPSRIRTITQNSSPRPAKRRKHEHDELDLFANPLASLLQSIAAPPERGSDGVRRGRLFKLQTILFFVERRRRLIPEDARDMISTALFGLLNDNDFEMQAWAFVTLASLAHLSYNSGEAVTRAESARHSVAQRASPFAFSSSTEVAKDWVSLWGVALRRITSPATCRAAAHAACTLLSNSLITRATALRDLEPFLVNLEVQGPTFPYDSVCAFLSEALRMIAKDVRLHRSHLEEHVIGWLSASWSPFHGTTRAFDVSAKMEAHEPSHVLNLMTEACRLPVQPPPLASRPLLPDCDVVQAVARETDVSPIKAFVLNAELPKGKASAEAAVGSGDALPSTAAQIPASSRAPTSSLRRVSAFLSRSMASFFGEYQYPANEPTVERFVATCTVEQIRRLLDLVVLAVAFQAAHTLNGFRPDREVLLGACQLLNLLTPCVTQPRWTPVELALLLQGFEPLFADEALASYDAPQDIWPALLQPGEQSGIRAEDLRKWQDAQQARFHRTKRAPFKVLILQDSVLQPALTAVSKAFRNLLQTGLCTEVDSAQPVVGKEDDFAGMVKVEADEDDSRMGRTYQILTDSPLAVSACTDICISGILRLSSLGYDSSQVVRDDSLLNMILETSAPHVLMVGPCLLRKVSQHLFHLNHGDAIALLDKLGSDILPSYEFGRSEHAQLLALRLLQATAPLWTDGSTESSELVIMVRQLCQFFSNNIRKEQVTSWKTRLYFLRFLDHYLRLDPRQLVWSEAEETRILPSALIQSMAADQDMRVRFRVATSAAQLFNWLTRKAVDPFQLYKDVREALSEDLDDFEAIISRILCLGNIMIASSHTRRGPYFHLLELSIHHSRYHEHIHAVLLATAVRLGFGDIASMYQAFARQMTVQHLMVNEDPFRIPVRLLGFRNRKQATEATFQDVAPVFLVRGREDAFDSLCKVLRKTFSEGVRESFVFILAHNVMATISDKAQENQQALPIYEDIWSTIMGDMARFTAAGYEIQDAAQATRDVVYPLLDQIVVALLEMLSEDDCSAGGPVIRALDADHEALQAFTSLMTRPVTSLPRPHSPNKPYYGASVTVHSLRLLETISHRVFETPTIYHVLRQLISRIHRTSIVNDQVRHMYSICLYVAMSRSTIARNDLCRRVLLHASVIFLANADLCALAFNLFDDAVAMCKDAAETTEDLGAILVRACEAALVQTRSANPAVRALGQQALLRLESWLGNIFDHDALRYQVRDALLFWPRPLPDELAFVAKAADLQSLTEALSRNKGALNMSTIVFRFRDALETVDDEDREHFASSSLWRLLEALRRDCRDNSTEGDMAKALADIIFSCQGRLHSPDMETLVELSPLSDMLKLSQPLRPDVLVPPKAVILRELAELLWSEDLRLVERAFRSLRANLALSPDLVTLTAKWPSELAREITVVAEYSISPSTTDSATMEDLLADSWHSIAQDYSSWVCRLATHLADISAASDPFYAQLRALTEADAPFARRLLPPLVHNVLLAEHINRGEGRSTLSAYFSGLLGSRDADVACLEAILDVALYLRCHDPPNPVTPLDNELWLEIDYSRLAACALRCKAFTTALLFVHLGQEKGLMGGREPAAVSETVLFNVYSELDEPDGFYGVPTTDVRDALIRRLHHEGQWRRAFDYHGAEFEGQGWNGSSLIDRDATERATAGVRLSLHSVGFNRLAATVGGLAVDEEWESSGNPNRVDYELGWRTGSWDLPFDDTASSASPSLSLYAALRAVHTERQVDAASRTVETSTKDALSSLRSQSLSTTSGLHDAVRNLLCLREVSRWHERFRDSCSVEDALRKIHQEGFTNLSPAFEFKDAERLLTTRTSLLRSISARDHAEQLGDLMSASSSLATSLQRSCLLLLSRRARLDGQLQAAINAATLAHQCDLWLDGSQEVQEEFANVLWAQDEHSAAMRALENVANNVVDVSEQLTPVHRAVLLAQLGEWTSTARMAKPLDIETRFFSVASGLLSDVETTTEASTVFFQYATFADEQYRNVAKSTEIARLRVFAERKGEEVRQLHNSLRRSQGTKESHQLNTAYRQAKQLHAQDQRQIEEYERSRSIFLERALEMYARALGALDDGPDAVIRLASLWLENSHNESLNSNFASHLKGIPSHKFVFLAHQLSARLNKGAAGSSDSPSFQWNLGNVMLRLCTDHPFHSLHPVYALRQGSPAAAAEGRRSRRGVSSPTDSQAGRTQAAVDLFRRVQQRNTRMAQRVANFELLCSACTEWAQFRLKGSKDYYRSNGAPKAGALPMPPKEQVALRRLPSNLDVPVATARTPIDPACQYKDIVAVVRYSDYFSIAGGLHAPKINDCVGSDGKRYKQLFKSEDDVRQDAIIQQVFNLVNSLLRRDRRTQKRSLNIRTYVVLPLGPQTGMLEYVKKTTSVGDAMVKMHGKYEPKDMRPSEARERLKQVQGGTPEEKIEVFEQICSRITPSFRHFFYEAHRLPAGWHAMRLNYTRSVATTSIVGHILGLGDRHVSNILIDQGSGEVVHIDFGIAFEQGMLLPIPELVPFRLTRDIIDGMGISGVEGVFRRCSEETLRVLRKHADIIRTVLEVFKYDPLHSWTANPIKVLRIQNASQDPSLHNGVATAGGGGGGGGVDSALAGVSETDTIELSADRALSSVSAKLSPSLSIEHTVNELIQRATDRSNLAQIFCGWQPWL